MCLYHHLGVKRSHEDIKIIIMNLKTMQKKPISACLNEPVNNHDVMLKCSVYPILKHGNNQRKLVFI